MFKIARPLLGASLLALGLAAAPAQALPTITYNAGSGAPFPGTTVFQDFEGFAPNSSIGTNAFATNLSNTSGARPAFGSTGNYGAVLTGGDWTVNFAAASVFSFVLGSLDTFNALTLFFSDGTSQLYQGGQIINDLSFPSGDQISGETNGVVRYTASTGQFITGARFQSAGQSFEFDNLASIAATAVPESATWAMMLTGFGALGFAMRRRPAANVRIRFA